MDTKNFKIEGTDEYKKKVQEHLKTIYGTPTGKKLIKSLNGSGKSVRISHPGNNPDGTSKGNWAWTDPPPTKSPAAGYLGKDGKPGTGANVAIGYDPDKNRLPGKKDAWANPPNRPPDVGLVHEMVHGDDFAHGRFDSKRELTSTGTKPASPKPSTVPNGELRAVGLGPYKRSDVSENAYRKDRGLKPRTRY